jgi:hypothetical protein
MTGVLLVTDKEGTGGGRRIVSPLLHQRLDAEFDETVSKLQALRRVQRALEAVVALNHEIEQPTRDDDLPDALERIVAAAADLTGARYGAIGVLDSSAEQLARFITVGLSEGEEAAHAGIGPPRGHGLLGHLIRDPAPLRVDDISAHPESVGFPPGHPPMRTLLGAAIRVRGRNYGDLYLSERYDGQPFDAYDQAVVVQLAAVAAGIIDRCRQYQQLREDVEQLQRLLLPELPDLPPFEAAALYRPSSGHPGSLGGDWYDAIPLPGDAVGAVIGDVAGHDLRAAAAMLQIRYMLNALLYDRRTPPSAVLTALDRALCSIIESPVTTACLARIEPSGHAWRLHWSSAGHLPPLLLTPDSPARYLYAEPGLPLGVDPGQPRSDATHPLPAGATVILFTDGLVEKHGQPIDEGLRTLAAIATTYGRLPLRELCQTLAGQRPGGGEDDAAILGLRTPARHSATSQ